MNVFKYNHFCVKRLLFGCNLSAIYAQNRHLSDNRVKLSFHKTSYVTDITAIDGNASVSPILIFHGLFGSKNNWKSISKSISAKTGRSVYALDLRNHGLSPHTSGTDSTLKAMANDINLFLEENNYKKATLIGHSLGGRVVLQFSFLWPEIVEKLVVVDISPLSSIPRSFFTKPSFTDELSDSLRDIPQDMSLSEARKRVNDKIKPIISDQFIRGFFLMSLDKNEKTSELFWRFNLSAIKVMLQNQYINQIDMKRPFGGQSLLIHGQNSEYVKKDDYKAIRELMPNIQIVCIPGTGHYLHVEKPNEFIDCVVSFLKSN